MVLKEEKDGVMILPGDSLADKAVAVEKSWIVVPRGGEYQLILPDGTKVWLNSDSKLEFPNTFVGDERRVKLAGEAYFEVAKNKAKPFRVEVDRVEVVVLGTSFNIHAYDEAVKTTLVEGAVKLNVAGKAYSLSPGFEANVDQGGVKIVKSDVYEQIAWKDGRFVFREKRLEEVMSILSRWYDFEIFYQNAAVKDLHFTGNIPRHTTINEVLKFLERTHLVHFSAFGKIVSSIVADLIMPAVGLLVGGVNFTDLKITLKHAVMEGDKVISPAVSINYGNFIQVTLDFIIIAFAVFLLVKGVNALSKKKEEAPKAPVAPPADIQLLTEIRDLLKNNK